MKPEEVRKSLPLQTNPRKTACTIHCVPRVSQHSWQESRSREDTGSAWTPEFQESFHQLPAGATDIAMETITTATSSKGSKIGAVIQDSSYGAAQPQNRNHPQAPLLGKVPTKKPVTQWLHCACLMEETLHAIPPGHGRKQRQWCVLHLKFTCKEWLSFSEASAEEEKSTGDFPGMEWGQRTLKDLQSRLWMRV